MNGVLIIDKPAGLTSHDVVNRVRRILGRAICRPSRHARPDGHRRLAAGDGELHPPRAVLHRLRKRPTKATIRFGFSTDTYDAEGERDVAAPNGNALQQTKWKQSQPVSAA